MSYLNIFNMLINNNLYLKSVIILALLVKPFLMRSQTNAEIDSKSAAAMQNYKAYVLKGSWMAGGTLSMNFKNTNDVEQLIRYVNKNRSYDFVLRLDGAYAINNYSFLGLALAYGQSASDGVFTNGDGEVFTEEFFGNQYSFSPLIKRLTPIDKHGRFNIITQIEFRNTIEQGIKSTILNESLSRRQTVKYTGLLGVRPGISVFVLKDVAFETTLNVAGIEYSYEHVKNTDQPDAHTDKASVNLRIDILQLNIGIFVYIK